MQVRGSIVCPSRPVPVGDGWVMGRKPGIVVYVKAASGRLMRDFRWFCGKNGIDAVAVQDHAFECVGTVESLERLADHPSVRDWHLILSVRPPRFSSGVTRDGATGVVQSPMPSVPKNVSARAAVAARMRSMSRQERMAVEAREERKAMSPDEREVVELVEALQLPH